MPTKAIWWLCGGLVAAGFVACSLDLDESLLDSGDAGTDTSVGGAGGGGTGGAAGAGIGGTGGKLVDSGGACDADPQCQTDGSCVEGRCASGTCVFELCPVTTACTGRSCDPATNTCNAPEAFTFKAGTISLPDDIGCSGVADRCIAAMDDFVFVGTTSGLSAWRVLSPVDPEPITAQAPPFAITRLIATNERLFILGPTSAGKLSIAWLDVPSDPEATELTISSAAVNFADSYTAAFPGADDRFFLVQNAELYPSAYLPHPLTSQTTVNLFPAAGIITGAQVVTSSGTRLLAYAVDTSLGTYDPSLGFINAAGTSNAQAGAMQALPFEAPNSQAAHRFTTGFDGSVLWTTNRIARPDGGGPETDAVILRWPVAAGTASIDAASELVIASYSPVGINAALSGPSALITSTVALVTVAYPPDTQQTIVRSVTRTGSSLALGAESPPPVLPFAPSQIGAAASRRFGFVLTPSLASPTTATTLHIFAPDC